MSLLARFALVAFLSISGLASAQAADLTSSQQKRVLEWATNNALATMYHEMGHMLFDQLGLPVLGREEDAADNVATYTLLEKHTSQADQALIDTAQGWLISSEDRGEVQDYDLYDMHGLDKQRAFAMVCMMVGADDDTFDTIADNYGMDEDRQDSCQRDWYVLKSGLDEALGPSKRKTKKNTQIKIVYQAASGRLKPAADAFKDSGIFEQVADEIKQTYALPNPLTFRAKRCGEINAWYFYDTRELVFCYELMDTFIAQITANLPDIDESTPEEPDDEPTAPASESEFGREDGASV